MTAVVWPDKDPDENLDFELLWGTVLDTGDTIATSTWIVPSPLVSGLESHTDTTTLIYLSGGTLGKTYEIVNRVVTQEGRTIDQTVHLRIATQ